MSMKGKFTIFFLLLLGLSGCASPNDLNDTTRQFLKEVTIEKQKVVLMPGPNGAWEPTLITETQTSLVAASSPVGNNTPPAPDTSVNSSQILITGEVKYFGFLGGTFRIEARGVIPCEDALCPDMNSIPPAAVERKTPGFFQLVVPNNNRDFFAVATYTPPDKQTKKQEIYLGYLTERKDNVVFNFTPDPSPPDGGVTGPDDLATP